MTILIVHDKNSKSIVVSVLIHKMGEGEGGGGLFSSIRGFTVVCESWGSSKISALNFEQEDWSTRNINWLRVAVRNLDHFDELG